MTVVSREDITKQKPEKSLVGPRPKSGGRNNTGRVTSRFISGGHKQAYRIIDFKRDKFGIPAKVAAIEYDPNRSARIALLNYADGEKRYIIAPEGLKVGATVSSGPEADILVGNALPLKNIPAGTVVHNIELRPGKGAQMARSAGTQAQLVSREGAVALLKLPSARSAARFDRMHGDDRRGRQQRSRKRFARQSRTQALDGQEPAQPRRFDEPGRSPAWRRRRQNFRRTSSGNPVGPADARLQDAQQQADGQIHRE